MLDQRTNPYRAYEDSHILGMLWSFGLTRYVINRLIQKQRSRKWKRTTTSTKHNGYTYTSSPAPSITSLHHGSNVATTSYYLLHYYTLNGTMEHYLDELLAILVLVILVLVYLLPRLFPTTYYYTDYDYELLLKIFMCDHNRVELSAIKYWLFFGCRKWM